MRALAVVALLVLGPHAAAQPGPSPAPRAPVGGPVTFRPKPGTTLHMADRPYRGTLELRPGTSGVSIVNELDLESYVMGLAEVPGSWPLEALKAQAVAARTYVLWERENQTWTKQGYDVCATTTCQVYAGGISERGERGQRWVEAVKATRGEVLLYKGRPALARYHASSGGDTLSNETVFPRSGRRPYLRAVRDPSDKVSPLHRWQVDFTREAMEGILRAGLSISGPLESLEADEEARTIVVRAGGRETELPVSRFRSLVSREAPKLDPSQYPGLRSDGRTMPVTLPSSRFAISEGEQGFRIEGRGYGHGVGMSQWGARGRAERGEDYRKIIGAYYGSLEPVRWTGAARIRVGLRRSKDNVAVNGDGAFSVHASGDALAESTVGTWTVAGAGGRLLRVGPPEGYRLPLVLSGVDAPDRVTIDRSQRRAGLEVAFVVPKAARIDAVLLRGHQRIAKAHDVFEAGPGRLRVGIRDPERLESAPYRLALTAYDGERRTTKTVGVRIERSGRGPILPAFLAVLFVLLAGAAVVWRNAQSETPTASRMKEYMNASSRQDS